MALLRRSSLQKGQACTGPEKFVRPTADSITGFIEIAYTHVNHWTIDTSKSAAAELLIDLAPYYVVTGTRNSRSPSNKRSNNPINWTQE